MQHHKVIKDTTVEQILEVEQEVDEYIEAILND